MPPRILQIYREPLKAGSERAYDAIETDTARISATLGCPHPYLGVESLTGPKEVWWFNGYESEADQKQVYVAYAANAPLLAALQQSSERKASLTLPHIEAFTSYREDLSTGPRWTPGQGRFLVITTTTRDEGTTGTVFEAPDGIRFIITSFQTRENADAAKALAGGEANVFAVRPAWSFAAEEWIASDPLFWQPQGR